MEHAPNSQIFKIAVKTYTGMIGVGVHFFKVKRPKDRMTENETTENTTK
jgi:hypothetical protein